MTIAGNVNVGPSSDTSTSRQPSMSRSVSPVLTISTYSSGSCLDATPSKKMQAITIPPSSLGGVGLDVGVSIGATVGEGVLVAVGVAVGPGVCVLVGTGDGTGVTVGIGVAVSNGAEVGVGVTVTTLVGVGVGSGV